jgi:hypothetical protein
MKLEILVHCQAYPVQNKKLEYHLLSKESFLEQEGIANTSFLLCLIKLELF